MSNKSEVIEYYIKNGSTPTQIASRFNLKRRTVNDWILEYQRERDLESSKKKWIKHQPHGEYKYGYPLKSDFGPGGHLDLELNKKTITKTVVLSDLHMPYNIDLSYIFEFISDFKPDAIILNGDIADWDCFSPHEPLMITNPLPFSDQRDLCLNLIKTLKQLCPKIIWVQGNHEDWARQTSLRNPSLYGTIEPHFWLPKDVGYVPLNHCVRVGKLRVLHGNCLRNERVAVPTRIMLQKWSDGHLLFGHYHRRETFTQVSEIGAEKRYAEMSGCLCSVNAAYMRNGPSAVSNGFTYLISEPDGNYWPTHPSIHHNKFVAEGKVYGPRK